MALVRALRHDLLALAAPLLHALHLRVQLHRPPLHDLREVDVVHPDLVGGFNRLDSTILKAGSGKVIAKEGADGLLGLAIEHPSYPKGLGIVIKIAHGWNGQATWYIARAILGTLGVELRNPYPLHRQKAFIVPGIVPPNLLEVLETIPTWDEWDPDQDRWQYDWRIYDPHAPRIKQVEE